MWRSLDDLFEYMQALVESSRLMNLLAAEEELDRLIQEYGLDGLSNQWHVHRMMVLENMATLYNNIGFRYQPAILEAGKQGDLEGQHLAAREAARCHGKALNLHGMKSPEDVLYLPSDHMPKVFIATFWGLGSSNYFLGKPDQGRKYLELCLRLRPPDQQAAALQDNARSLCEIMVRQQ